MSSLSISKAWDESKAIAARDGRLIGAVALGFENAKEPICGIRPIEEYLTTTVIIHCERQVAMRRQIVGPPLR